MFEGVIPIVQTPFFEDGALDLDSLKRQIHWLCELGVDGVAYPGFVSEWWKLSETEMLDAMRAIIEAAQGRVPVIGNVTAQATYLAVEQAKAFQALGCTGLMCLPPFVVPRAPAALIAHQRAVLEAVPLPHILQYSASLTGIRLEASQLKALRAEFPHFSCIKVDFIPPGPVVSDLIDSLGEGFTYLIGFAGLQLADCLKRGAHGLMGGAGHTREDIAVFRALKADPDGAGRVAFEKLLPLINLEMQTIDLSIATHKWLLKQLGIISSDHVRKPGPVLDRWQQEELRGHMRRLGAAP